MMDKTVKRNALLKQAGLHQQKSEVLVVERPLQIIVNGNEYSITMQTPGDEAYLVRGLLHSEGIEPSDFIVFGLEEKQDFTVACVEIDCEGEFAERRRIASTSSCGLCGKQSVDKLFDGLDTVSARVEIPSSTIHAIFREIDESKTLFSQTGGCHAASAATRDGKVLCVFEDIGRHNAVDKVIGWLIEHKQQANAAVLTVSGRISYEIIQKCIRIRVPVLAAISAPSALAVDTAEKYGVTLAAFCRKDRLTVYSHASRIIENNKEDVEHV
jgi:FdhD protein